MVTPVERRAVEAGGDERRRYYAHTTRGRPVSTVTALLFFGVLAGIAAHGLGAPQPGYDAGGLLESVVAGLAVSSSIVLVDVLATWLPTRRALAIAPRDAIWRDA